ncbi:MAG: tetratricopeptide repeat protein [Bacteroidota bacterium]|nr:tetratricopeptide repeat protein [Candidatus Kapabacteria bacterium]MDW8221190.1 tetratricopeptide repeat protein [Bacteroidota bacterium]
MMSRSSSVRSSSSGLRHSSLPFAQNYRRQALIVILFAILLYGQTLRFDLVMDDHMVITDHRTVQRGLAGIPDLLTKDSFAGFDESYDRSGQRKTYRPLSFISFALEKQFFNNAPAIGHGINIALYALTLALMLRLLREMTLAYTDITSSRFPEHYHLLPFASTLLFAAHPAHTAVVANIKSRDELLALLFGVSSLLMLLRSLRYHTMRDRVLSVVLFCLALLSKESAVLFLPVVVLLLYVFTRLPALGIVRLSLLFACATGLFLLLWFGLVGRVEESLYTYRLYNPFVQASLLERCATASMIFGFYLLKALFPWTLSEGYTYNAVPLVGWDDWRAWGGLLLAVSMLSVSVVFILRRTFWAFGTLGLCITLLLASNLFVYVGSMLGDRFLYTPSFFAVLAITWLIFEGFGAHTKRFRLAAAMGIIAVLVLLYSVRTLTRLPDWHSDYKLLQADHRTTPASIMTARNYATQLLLRAGRANNSTERTILLDEVETVVGRALQVDSTADPALYDLLGLAALQRQDFDKALAMIHYAVFLDSTTRKREHRKPIFRKNLSSIYVSRAALAINQDRLEDGKRDLQRALELNPNNDNVYINLGMIYGRQGNYLKALEAFQTAYKLNPSSSIAQQYIFHIQQALEEERKEAEERLQNTASEQMQQFGNQ